MDKPKHFQLVVQSADTELIHQAQSIAQQYGFNLSMELPKDSICLSLESNGLGLVDTSAAKQRPIMVNFDGAEITRRLKQANKKSEPLLRAIGPHESNLKVLDATPGLARDALLFAHAGFAVTLVERHPAIAAMLVDGIRRHKNVAGNRANIFEVINDDSVKYMRQRYLSSEPQVLPDVIYLDPMFPHRQKSALVKKDMQILQRLLGVDQDADQLLLEAKHLARRRVVVKRPNSAPYLADMDPDMSVTSKKHRFDVYLNTSGNNVHTEEK